MANPLLLDSWGTIHNFTKTLIGSQADYVERERVPPECRDGPFLFQFAFSRDLPFDQSAPPPTIYSRFFECCCSTLYRDRAVPYTSLDVQSAPQASVDGGFQLLTQCHSVYTDICNYDEQPVRKSGG